MIYRVLVEEIYTKNLMIQAESRKEAEDIADEYMANTDMDVQDFSDREVQVVQELDDSASVNRTMLITKEDIHDRIRLL